MRHDRLYDVQWHIVKSVLFGWIDRLDKLKQKRAEDVVISTAIALHMICARFALNPRAVMDTADKVIRRATLVDPQYPRAIAQFLREEFRDE